MTDRYDYFEATLVNVKCYIQDEIDLSEWRGRAEELALHLDNVLWDCDEITGNASGSYYCNAWKAEEALAHNWDELAEALEVFGMSDLNPFAKGAEWCDVLLRCYHLPRAIDEALEELADELEEEVEV